MKRMVFVVVIGFLLGLLLANAAPVIPADIEGRAQAMRALQASVVLVFKVGDNPPRYKAGCGGTLVAPDKVLTAFHCVRNEKANVTPYMEPGAVVAGTVNWYRADVDLATVQLERAVKGRVADFAPDVYPGDSVWLVGAPNVTGQDFPFMLTRGTVGQVRVDVFANCKEDNMGVIGTGLHQMILTDVMAFFGNSGGGGFNSNGQLIGVLVRGEVADDAPCGTVRDFTPALLWAYLVGPDTLRLIWK